MLAKPEKSQPGSARPSLVSSAVVGGTDCPLLCPLFHPSQVSSGQQGGCGVGRGHSCTLGLLTYMSVLIEALGGQGQLLRKDGASPAECIEPALPVCGRGWDPGKVKREDIWGASHRGCGERVTTGVSISERPLLYNGRAFPRYCSPTLPVAKPYSREISTREELRSRCSAVTLF